MVNDFYTFTDASKNLNIKLYDNEEKIDAITSSKSFRGRTILGNGVVAVSTTPLSINRKKAFAVGFTILEISKLLMFQAWYDRICKVWPTARLLATDTDR